MAELQKLVPVRFLQMSNHLVILDARPSRAGLYTNKLSAGTLAFSSRTSKPIMNIIWSPDLRSCLTAALLTTCHTETANSSQF